MRSEGLRDLLHEIETIDLADNTQFCLVINTALELCALSELEIAEAVNVTRPTVNRWAHGKVHPHVALRPRIYSLLEDRAKKDLRQVEAAEKRKAEFQVSMKKRKRPVEDNSDVA